MNLLEGKNLTVAYRGRPVVCGIDMTLHRGEVVGLLGPNGAGKSTLVKALSGILPFHGTLVLRGRDGRPVKNARARAQTAGYLAQDASGDWKIPVKRLAELGRFPHLQPWQALGPEDYRWIDKAIDETGIRHLSEKSFAELAGGEKALVMLARVLAGDPSLVFADEPVSHLDPHHQIRVMELLADFARGGGSVLAVLHDLNLASRFCDKIYLMDRGHFAAEGTPGSVLTAERLREVYKIEVRFIEDGKSFWIVPGKGI